jgi:hypothetical protein
VRRALSANGTHSILRADLADIVIYHKEIENNGNYTENAAEHGASARRDIQHQPEDRHCNMRNNKLNGGITVIFNEFFEFHNKVFSQIILLT